KSMNNYLISDLTKQAHYSENIFPDSTNTIRLLVMQDPDNKFEPFIASAVHRFGTESTIPADNWSKGGLSSLIDLEQGTLGPGVSHPKNTNGILKFVNKHPDTGEMITNIRVPHWEKLTREILNITRELNIKYIGWDILVTNDGYSIIEGNCNSDLDLLQVHSPLLKNRRVKRFMGFNNYIKK